MFDCLLCLEATGRKLDLLLARTVFPRRWRTCIQTPVPGTYLLFWDHCAVCVVIPTDLLLPGYHPVCGPWTCWFQVEGGRRLPLLTLLVRLPLPFCVGRLLCYRYIPAGLLLSDTIVFPCSLLERNVAGCCLTTTTFYYLVYYHLPPPTMPPTPVLGDPTYPSPFFPTFLPGVATMRATSSAGGIPYPLFVVSRDIYSQFFPITHIIAAFAFYMPGGTLLFICGKFFYYHQFLPPTFAAPTTTYQLYYYY